MCWLQHRSECVEPQSTRNTRWRSVQVSAYSAYSAVQVLLCVAALSVSPLWAGDNGRPQFGAGTAGRMADAGAGRGAEGFSPTAGRGSVTHLAALPEVQKELGLSAGQKEALEAMAKRVRAVEEDQTSIAVRWASGQPQAAVESAWARVACPLTSVAQLPFGGRAEESPKKLVQPCRKL
jgi:hypothetical protein